jgi:hypothetical protein
MEIMSEFVTIQGMKIEVERMGSGSPLLVLLSEEAAFERTSPFIAELAKTHELVMPMAPGFGNSERPDWISLPEVFSFMGGTRQDKIAAAERAAIADVRKTAATAAAAAAAQLIAAHHDAKADAALIDVSIAQLN